MKVFIKMLQGVERLFEVDPNATGIQLKEKIFKDLNISTQVQRLIYKGKSLSDESSLLNAGVQDNGKIHLIIKKSELVTADKNGSNDFYIQLDKFLCNHLNFEQTTKVISEFKKNFTQMIDSMNFDDIERFASSNFTHF